MRKWITFKIISLWSDEHSCNCCRHKATRLTTHQITWLRIPKFLWRLSFEFLNRVVRWFCKMCSADPKESATGSQVICRFIPVMASWKFTYFLKCNKWFHFKLSQYFFNWPYVHFVRLLWYLLEKSFTYYVSYTHFNQSQIMQCLVMNANCMYSYVFEINYEIWNFYFGHLIEGKLRGE